MKLVLDVSIWGWQGIGIEWGRVGHVMVSDSATGKALLSQFPHRLGQSSFPKGPNTLLSFGDTYTEEGGKPDVVYEVTIEEQFVSNFNLMVNDHIQRPIWDWDPTPPEQTHCARSAYDALKAGGLNFDLANDYKIKPNETNEILPNSLWYLLEDAGFRPLGQRSQNLALNTIKDNEMILSLARQHNLWA